MNPASLEARFRSNLVAAGLGEAPARLLVAVSGGRDSVALLFLLRFCAGRLPISLTVAHLDHAMRPGSADDAAWVRGLCTAWGLPLVSRRLRRPPGGEAEARAARYRFLRRAAREVEARWIVTAHHADDQAETVLYRALRGSGLTGLRGMRPAARGVLRPLLPFWGSEIEAFALGRGLRWREDPSNRSLEPVRNRIRHELLPLLEARVAPGARRSLVSLAEIAGEAERALARDAGAALASLVRPSEGGFLLARTRLAVYDSAIGSRVVRKLLRRFGVVLDRPGTRRALAFITRAPSGREMRLPGGVRVRLEFDSAWVGRPADDPADAPLVIAGPEPGTGEVVVGGARFRVEHGPGRAADAGPDRSVELSVREVRFPLVLRGWAPGDRAWTTGGTKSLKKLFLEQRVPRSLRHRLPVLVDASGKVLWVAGAGRALHPAPRPGEPTFFVTALHA